MSNKKYIMALDQGTTSSRCIIFDRAGHIVSKAQRELPQIYPQPGWAEHNPFDILATQTGVISEALAGAWNIDSTMIDSAGIANQRETALVWDRHTGKPVYNAIVWQCRRTAEYCNKLKKEGYDQVIYEKTGLELDAYFSATKIKWILDNVKGARESAEKGDLIFGTVDTFLLWHLTRGRAHATDYSNASRTMLFNIHTLTWDSELLKKFGIPKSMLPAVYPSSHGYGTIDNSIIGGAIPINALAGDQQSALFGQLCVKPGMIKNTYGTGCFMLMNTGHKPVVSRRGLVTTVAASIDNKPHYALEGSVFIAGAAVQWLRDGLRMIETAEESEEYALRVPDTNGVYMVPAFAGLGAPYWDPGARGVFCGLTRGAKKEHLIRACLEAIAYQVFDIFHAMEKDTGIRISELAVDGGASKNNFLMQFQADILGIPVRRPSVVETTALGACYLAGLRSGFYNSVNEIRGYADPSGRVYRPGMSEESRNRLIMGWVDAVSRARAK